MARTLALSGIQFDGVQNYVSLGTMGNFGSNLGSGFYCKFDIKTTSTAKVNFGLYNNGLTCVIIAFNTNYIASANVANEINFVVYDDSNKQLAGGLSSPITFNDGNLHTIIITANFGTNTITISIDGNVGSIGYSKQQTPSNFHNFGQNFLLGAFSQNGTAQQFMPCTLDNILLGTSSSVLYGNYPFMGDVKDYSGQGNNGTLNGNPLPKLLRNYLNTRTLASPRTLASVRTLTG